MIVDVHTHAFPDALAERAMRALLAEAPTARAYHDGRLASLEKSMDCAGIDRAVVCSIATRPEQFDKILAWSRAIASDRFIPFPSVHPRDPDAIRRLRQISQEGFRGIKLHPYYQDFVLDDESMDPIYACLQDLGLILASHTGFDIAFPRERRCDPARIARVMGRFPRLKLVATHLGAWSDWDEVRRYLIGRPIYLEISYSLGEMPDDEARDMILRHPPEYVLFGTDSPWQDQKETLDRLRGLDVGAERETAILGGNACRLLNLGVSVSGAHAATEGVG